MKSDIGIQLEVKVVHMSVCTWNSVLVFICEKMTVHRNMGWWCNTRHYSYLARAIHVLSNMQYMSWVNQWTSETRLIIIATRNHPQSLLFMFLYWDWSVPLRRRGKGKWVRHCFWKILELIHKPNENTKQKIVTSCGGANCIC